MADQSTERRISPDVMGPGGNGPGGNGDGIPKPKPPQPIPPFQAANYTFRLVSMSVLNTRSAHEDSDKVSFAVAIGSGTPVTQTKDMGDVNNGTFPIGLSVGPVQISDPNIGIALNYIIVNSGHASWDDVNKLLTGASSALAGAGAKAATAAIGAAIGAQVGSAVLPVVGTIVGLITGWLAGELTGILTADCDGNVAAEQPAFKGQQLWNDTAHGPYSVTTYHNGSDSPSGCGSNSIYTVTWSITRS